MTTQFEELLKNKMTAGKGDEIGLKRIVFYREKGMLELTLHSFSVLSCDAYEEIASIVKENTGSDVRLLVETDDSTLSAGDLHRYLNRLNRIHPETSILSDAVMNYDNSRHTLSFLYNDSNESELASASADLVSEMLKEIGCENIHVSFGIKEKQESVVKDIPLEAIPIPEEPKEPVHREKKNHYRTKMSDYTQIELKDIHDPISDIQFDCDIFKKEEKETKKTQRIIQTLSVFDGTDAISVKRFEGRNVTREDLAEVGEGDRIRVYGRIEYDTYAKDLVCTAQSIEKLERKKVVDNAEKKRVEFHMHTNMSEMDGVCDIKEVVDYAWNLGHRGIVITDHADVQSFVKAYNNAQGLKKKDPERDFRIGLGCEMNLANDRLLIVRDPIDGKIEDQEYISFDLETTGLSCYYDHIIEFGAVKIKNQTVTDRLQMFIKPPVPIPPFISAKTNITNDMVKNAKTFAEAADEILDWIGDGILVAHNATFDYHFMNEELRRLGRPPLTNTVIDTLDLSRAVLKERRAYRLGNVARNYHVSYDEEVAHRADYDAEALAGVFLCLLKDAKTKFGCVTVRDLQDKIQDERAFVKVRRSHVCVIAKNHDGLKDLYKLVTQSNTKTLAVMGKASGKEGTDVAAEPRVLRSELQKHRENLLVGSACSNGEVQRRSVRDGMQRRRCKTRSGDALL